VGLKQVWLLSARTLPRYFWHQFANIPPHGTLLICLFILDLFKDALSFSAYLASHDGIIAE
jgi:hypothetical protein